MVSNKTKFMDTQSALEIVITRIFNARREMVYNAWTDPIHIAQWWGPKGFTTRVTMMNLRPGGQWRYVMIDPDGNAYPMNGVFREIVPFERIVTSDEFGEGFETVTNADLPQGMMVTAIFENLGGKTKLTLRILHATGEDRRKHEEMGVIPGWNSSLDCLGDYLAKV